MDTKTAYLQGGVFLVQEQEYQSVFSPDDFEEEQLMLRQSLQDFLDKRVESRYQDFDGEKGYELAPQLLEEMGQMGFLGIGVPDTYGGMEAGYRTQLAMGEIAYSAWSFGLAIGVQTSLGVAPLLLYGNPEQKAKYLPGIVEGRIKSCYCLTEPGAGSDANSGKTRATLSADGNHYLLNGQKMWITGSGYADLFFVFAKIDQDPNLSCFIVEKAFGGIRLGAEEKKMGIKGSSTRQVFFENVPVPTENLLGKRNEGFKIALNVLNTGRLKMSVSVTGVAKRALKYGIEYALQREQFGRPIAQFGAIQHKIGEMCARIYTMESIGYRIGGCADQAFEAMMESGMDPEQAKVRSIAEFAMEAAIAKVHNTEGDAFVIDEALQIHGGMGFSSESPIETLYRNARVNRIYEGTNEINRMLSVEMLLRKAMKEPAIAGQAQTVLAGMMKGQLPEAPKWNDAPLEYAQAGLTNAKKAVLLLFALAAQNAGDRLRDEQEILLHLADGLIQTYALESVLLRTRKYAEKNGPSKVRDHYCILQLHRTMRIIREAGLEILGMLPQGENWVLPLQTLCALPALNLKNIRREIAEIACKNLGFPLKDI